MTTKRYSLIKIANNWNIKLINLLDFENNFKHIVVYDDSRNKFEIYKISGDMETVISMIGSYDLSEIDERTKNFVIITDKDVLLKLRLLCIKYRKY